MDRTSHRTSHRTTRALGATVALSFGLVSTAWAGDETVAEKVQHGEVNWTEKTVLATGSGAPDLKLPNVAAIRIAAERAAKVSAYRNVLEALTGVRISPKKLAGERLGDTQIKTQVEGMVQGCKTVDTRYFSDYGVDVVIQCKLDGGLATVLAPPSTHRPFQTVGDRKFTGLVIDAVGLKVKPALAPRVQAADGSVLYEAEMVKPSFLRTEGSAVYFRTVDGAKKAPRVGDNPFVVRASSLGDSASDVRLSAEDVERLKAENLWFLLEGRVAIATDGP
jgi:hypothetical protein